MQEIREGTSHFSLLPPPFQPFRPLPRFSFLFPSSFLVFFHVLSKMLTAGEAFELFDADGSGKVDVR